MGQTNEPPRMNPKDQPKPSPIVVHAGIATVELTALPGTVWLTYAFARDWYKDALREAREGRDHHARRREILFAVCAAESYLVEWTITEALKRNFKRQNEYFPIATAQQRYGAFRRYFRRLGFALINRGVPRENLFRAPLHRRWKNIPKRLYRTGEIAGVPDFGDQDWQQFRLLLTRRHGLVHASGSRAHTTDVPEHAEPEDMSRKLLDTIAAGWATQVVKVQIERLNAAARTPIPDWLQAP